MYMCKSNFGYMENWKDIATFEHFDVQSISLFINGNDERFIDEMILVAGTQLYKRLCPSVG